MPDRPVWGTSNDDMHRTAHIGHNWEVLLVPDGSVDSAGIRRTLLAGRFFAVYNPGDDTGNVVIPDSVTVNSASITVIAACHDDSITWIGSGGIVGTGATFTVDESSVATYVRAEIHGQNGARMLLQPFGTGSQKTPVVRSTAHRAPLAIHR